MDEMGKGLCRSKKMFLKGCEIGITKISQIANAIRVAGRSECFAQPGKGLCRSKKNCF